MAVCALREPTMQARGGGPILVGSNDVACWAANPLGLTEEDTAPLVREELSVADEA
jgi:hypothetical protein